MLNIYEVLWAVVIRKIEIIVDSCMDLHVYYTYQACIQQQE